MPQFTLQELAKHFALKFEGNPDHSVVGVSTLNTASSTQLSFCRSEKHAKLLSQTKAGIVVLMPSMAENFDGNCLLANDPTQVLIDILALLHPTEEIKSGCHDTATVANSVTVPSSAFIGANAVIGENVRIGENVVVSAGCFVGANCVLGDDTCLAPNVTLYDNVRLGKRVSIHAGSVIGADGFGYHRAGYVGPWKKIPQIGGVVIEDDVEIGSSSTIDCGSLGDTYISKGVKIDNQVTIAHNVFIGEYTAIAACSGIAGSTRVGSNCILAGHCGLVDNINVTDNVILLGKAGVSNSIKEPGIYGSGTGLFTRMGWFRLVARLRNLDKTIKAINKKLEKIDV